MIVSYMKAAGLPGSELMWGGNKNPCTGRKDLEGQLGYKIENAFVSSTADSGKNNINKKVSRTSVRSRVFPYLSTRKYRKKQL